MARQKAKGVFIVTGFQAEPEESVPGLEFKSASDATNFAQKMNKTAIRLWAKLNGVSKEDAKKKKSALGMDVLMQPTGAEGNHVGNPMLYETIGAFEPDVEDEDETEETEEETEDEEDEDED